MKEIIITDEMLRTLDDRALKWYRKCITRLDQDCLEFEKCYKGDPDKVFHKHFQKLEQLLTAEIGRRNNKDCSE